MKQMREARLLSSSYPPIVADEAGARGCALANESLIHYPMTRVFIEPQGEYGLTEQARRHMEVACAVIEKGGLVLAAQRSEVMSMPLKWEFPGGKIHDGESPGDCLLREIEEELGVAVAIKGALKPVAWRYADFSVTLHPFVCEITGGEITLHEHRAMKWLKPEELLSLDWPEADEPVIGEYLAKRTDRTDE